MTPSATTVRTIARGTGSHIAEARRVVVRNDMEWRALWAAHAGPDGVEPPIDFAAEMVAAVFGGERPTAGYDIEIVGVRREGTALAVVVAEGAPGPGAMTAQIIVTPFHIAALPRYDGDVRFAGVDEPRVAAARGSRRTIADDAAAPSTTGLDPTLAAALAYLAGPFSGIVILLAERTNRYVSFHAWQSIIGLGGLAALTVLLLMFAFLTLFLSPLMFAVLYRISALTGLVWIGVWIVCLYKAYKGEAWKLPIAGTRAERRA